MTHYFLLCSAILDAMYEHFGTAPLLMPRRGLRQYVSNTYLAALAFGNGIMVLRDDVEDLERDA